MSIRIKRFLLHKHQLWFNTSSNGLRCPIKAPVAGIAMGLVTRDDSYTILADIQGMEDALGDMDLKWLVLRRLSQLFKWILKLTV